MSSFVGGADIVVGPGGVTTAGGADGESDLLVMKPLGSGQEVGRSCHYLEFKDKRILLDCGIHPGLKGEDALPFVDMIDASNIDLLLVSHFHLDHAGALPWFLQRTTFHGKCYMTHATKAIYRWLLSDYIKVSNISSSEQNLYTEKELVDSMEKIDTMDFHSEKEVNGIKFWAYNAGHVLGAAMFMIEIAGVKILYTGDFSCEKDRHLMAAEMPLMKPDVLIIEATYGIKVHEPREERERRFTQTVYETVTRGGRCLIPVFALGRAQELLLILDEYWSAHPELHEIPIYYASAMAKKCMAVYQTFVNAMNEEIRERSAVDNPFVFKHISNLKGMDHFDDVGPCVVLASPGMMQSGLSRELFESWCTDARNCCIVAGYCVEGTMAKYILSEPEDVPTMSPGSRLPLKMKVSSISFSAHADFKQTSNFIRQLKPPHVIFVHGEANEMSRLKAAMIRNYEEENESADKAMKEGKFAQKITFHNPRNTSAVELYFRGEKLAKVIGSLAEQKPRPDQAKQQRVSGVLVKRNFNYHMVSPKDLTKYTDLTTSTVTQRQSIYFSCSFALLHFMVSQLGGGGGSGGAVEVLEGEGSKKVIRAFGAVDVIYERRMVTLEWVASPVNDMYADAILCAILQTESMESQPTYVPPAPSKVDKMHFKECLIEMLQDMFGEESVPRTLTGDKLEVIVDGKTATIDLSSLGVTCSQDDVFQQMVTTAVLKLHHSLVPAEPNKL